MGMNLDGGGTSRRRRKHKGFSDINVTPMVDVMLVLLIIFMVTAPMLTAGVSVDLPEASAKPVAGNDEPLSVSLKTGGKIYVQNTEVRLEELAPKLQAILGEKKETRIFVRGDKSLDYGQVMSVVSTIANAGFVKVALITTEPGVKTR